MEAPKSKTNDKNSSNPEWKETQEFYSFSKKKQKFNHPSHQASAHAEHGGGGSHEGNAKEEIHSKSKAKIVWMTSTTIPQS